MTIHARLRTCLVAGAVAAAVVSVAAPADAAPPKHTPVPTISVSPTSPTNKTTATWTFSDSNKSATFACSLDGARYAACTSPKTFTGLRAGTHTLTVRATVPGWRSASASSRLVVDLTPPAAPTISGMPTAPTNAPVTPSFTTNEPATFQCSVDDAPWAACTTSMDATADGLRTLSARAVDMAGNVGPAASATWVRDTSVSKPFVLTGPTNPTIDLIGHFTVGDDDSDATLSCSLDSNAFTDCGAPFATPVGAHSLVVKATDALGNTSLSDAYAWTVVSSSGGSLPASLTWTSSSLPGESNAGVTSQASATFDYKATGASVVSCTLDGAATTCTTTQALVGPLADGSHTFVVTATATSGGPDAQLSYTWVVDTTKPAAPSITGVSRYTKSTSISALVVPSDLADALSCTFDVVSPASSTPKTCSASTRVTAIALADGDYSVNATETDQAGNTSSASFLFTVDTKAPSATVTTPTTLGGAAVVTFDEDMTAASSSPALKLASGATVASVRTCLTVGGAATPCTGTAVRTVRLRPVASWVPGGYYSVSVNGAGATPVTDLAGNAAPASSTAFRAATTVDELSPGTTASWRRVATSAAKGGSFVLQTTRGARASWAFTGTGFTVFLVSGPAYGVANVYVDGKLRGSWNQYASSLRFSSAHSVTGLAKAKHTVTVVVAGKKARAAKGFTVGIDAYKVGRTVIATPALATRWNEAAMAGSYLGHEAVSVTAGTAFTSKFYGTGITWSHAVGVAYGIATVYVDGVKKATVDSYAATSKASVVWSISRLANAQHTITIVVTGTKRAASKGTAVAVDRLTVL